MARDSDSSYQVFDGADKIRQAKPRRHLSARQTTPRRHHDGARKHGRRNAPRRAGGPDEAGQVLRAFQRPRCRSRFRRCSQGTATFSADQKDLIEKAAESIAQLASASDRLAGLRRSDATQTAEKLAKEFEVLDRRASDTGDRLAHAGDTVSKQVETLNEQTQRAEGQMLDATKSFREQFERVRAGVQGQIDDINRGLMQITAQLERTGNTLNASTTAGTVADVERISQRFDQTSKEAATQLVDKTARMRRRPTEVAKASQRLRRSARCSARPSFGRGRRHQAA